MLIFLQNFFFSFLIFSNVIGYGFILNLLFKEQNKDFLQGNDIINKTIITKGNEGCLFQGKIYPTEDVPVKDNLEDFILKNIDKDKLFNFLREMEFNRLLSSVISTYGEPNYSNEKNNLYLLIVKIDFSIEFSYIELFKQSLNLSVTIQT